MTEAEHIIDRIPWMTIGTLATALGLFAGTAASVLPPQAAMICGTIVMVCGQVARAAHLVAKLKHQESGDTPMDGTGTPDAAAT